MSPRPWPSVALAATLALLTLPMHAARAQQDEPLQTDPKVIWPADMTRLAGRYKFAQVASPGGLWATKGGADRQVSINELPLALKVRLTQAEVTISDLQLPSTVEASERISPSKRGRLRFFNEIVNGRLTMRNLPGVGGDGGDEGNFAGPVRFALDHISHSNPSVAGVLTLREHQERTWGVATLDYADLSATPLLAAPKPEDEPGPAIANARILRSGVEIFAFVEWQDPAPKGLHYVGSVRLARVPTVTPTAPPASTT